MIFVTVGSSQFRFDRLIKSVDQLIQEGTLRGEVFFQIGCNEPPQHGKWERFIPFGLVVDYIQKCRIVIAHGGAASILLCRTFGKIPVMMPREKKYGEVVDDHQIEFLEKVQKEGWVRTAYNMDELREVISRTVPERSSSVSAKGVQSRLAEFLITQF